MKSVLKEITPHVYDLLNTRSLIVRLKGLEIMNDDPSHVGKFGVGVVKE